MKNIILLLLLPFQLFSQDLKTITHDVSSPIDDYTGTFSEMQKIELTSLIKKYWDTVQIAIVMVPSTNGEDISQASVELFNRWGIGSKSNNGLLILIAKNDRKMFMSTGGGIQGEMTDAITGRLQRTYATPKFKQGDYYGGVYSLVEESIKVLSSNSTEYKANAVAASSSKDDDGIFGWILLIIFGIGMSAIGLGLYFSRKQRKEKEAQDLLNKQRMDKQLEDLRRNKTYVDTGKSKYPSYTSGAYLGSQPEKKTPKTEKKKDYDSYIPPPSYDYTPSYSSSYNSPSSSSSSSSSASSSSTSFDFGGGSSDGGGSDSSW